MKPKHDQPMPAEFCNHANEVPAVCTCPPTCYCKTHTCAKRVNDSQTGVQVRFIDKFESVPSNKLHYVDLTLDQINQLPREQRERFFEILQNANAEQMFVLVAVDLDRKEIDKLNHKRLSHMGHKISISDFDLVENAIIESMQFNYWSTKVKVFKVDFKE